MWYRSAQSQEFVGSDGASNGFIQDTKIRNVENQFLPGNIMTAPPQGAVDITRFPSKKDKGVPENCPACGSPIEEHEIFTGFYDVDGNTVFECKRCGHTNNPYKRTVTLKNQPSRVKKRRRKRSSSNSMLREASPPTNVTPGGASSYNPMNTPWGRLDLSQDERVIPWDRIQDGFEEEWDFRKQKGRDTKVVKIKGADGKYKYIRIKKRGTHGKHSVQPSNVYKQKGRVKKQNRYKWDNPQSKLNPGSWPHNRQPTPNQGWYQSPAGQNYDVDMRHRVQDWNSWTNDRNVPYTNRLLTPR